MPIDHPVYHARFPLRGIGENYHGFGRGQNMRGDAALAELELEHPVPRSGAITTPDEPTVSPRS